MRLAHVTALALVVFLSACVGPGSASPDSPASVAPAAGSASASARQDAARAITALQDGDFDEAARTADAVIDTAPDNPYARLVRAIARYRKTMHQLALDGRTVVFGALEDGGFNDRYLRFTLEQAERDLATVDADLAIAERTPDIALELCLACWKIDWNGNGRMDRFDRFLLHIEQDAEGNPIAEDDPRRTPTFRFDVGDVTWARAFVAFQRAAMDVVLAYDWTEVTKLAEGRRRDRPRRVVLRLRDAGRMTAARALLLQGLDLSDACRRAYLAETDDDREWVPNPRQRSHPLPLPVDEPLYGTWEGVVQDVRKLVRGEERLCMAEIGAMIDEDVPPMHGCIDVAGLLDRPRDIVVDLEEMERFERQDDAEGMLSSILGPHYVRGGKPSGLPRRLQRMHREMERGEESLERKLRYLFWIN